jgi:hypothetical protein
MYEILYITTAPTCEVCLVARRQVVADEGSVEEDMKDTNAAGRASY